MIERTTTRRGAGVLLAAMWLAVGPARTVPAGQDDRAAAQAREEIGAQIEELGTTLKAAAMSGAISGEEARAIYGRVVRAAKASYLRDFGDGDGESKAEDAPNPKMNVIRLTAPRPERIRVLLEAEFLRRDLLRIQDELGLDRHQMRIARFLFEDHAEAFELAAAPFREALAQYRGFTLNSYIAFALEDAGVRLEAAVASARRADRGETAERMAETLARIEREKGADLAEASAEDRAEYEAWKRSMIDATTDLGDRLADTRAWATARLAAMESADAAITAEDLLRLARRLRSDRDRMGADLIGSIEMVPTERQRVEANGRFEVAVTRIRIGRLLPRGRLGGESMDLWAAWAETRRDLASRPDARERLVPADDILDAWAPEIAARLDARTDATIDREIAGIEYRSVRDRIAAANGESIFEIEERRLAAAIGPYAAALRREVTASVAARDALLSALGASAAHIEELYPGSGLADHYRAASFRRGFPVETRRRWAERAVAAALELDGLDGDVLETLLALEVDVAAELQPLRRRAIERRIRRDPKLALDLIESEFGDEQVEFDDDVWRELEHAAFAAVDERAASRLQGILGPEQLERLPVREVKEAWGKATAKEKQEKQEKQIEMEKD